MENIKIGTNQINYPEIRNFASLPYSKKIQFVKERDLFNTLLNVYFRFTGKVLPFLQFLHYDFGISKTKLKHFFNTISFSRRLWFVTFETTVPRLENSNPFWYNIAVKQLASKRCKKIIAISKCTYDLQLEFLNTYYPEYFDTIKSKMTIIYPPQKLSIKSYNEKNINEKNIIFTIVGSDFFRKGGREILLVFSKLIEEGLNIKLNIVSSLEYGDYATHTTLEDYNNAFKIINKYPMNITHYNTLKNDEVIELFKSSHIGLLPTWGETFGYSVLEAQASGCPVISTNLRALPEINNNDIGWLIEVPKNSDQNGLIDTVNARNIFSLTIQNQLEDIIKKILSNPAIIKQKAIKSLNNIKLNHNPKNVASFLENLYIKYIK